jgi:hypothetical protein
MVLSLYSVSSCSFYFFMCIKKRNEPKTKHRTGIHKIKMQMAVAGDGVVSLMIVLANGLPFFIVNIFSFE